MTIRKRSLERGAFDKRHTPQASPSTLQPAACSGPPRDAEHGCTRESRKNVHLGGSGAEAQNRRGLEAAPIMAASSRVPGRSVSADMKRSAKPREIRRMRKCFFDR